MNNCSDEIKVFSRFLLSLSPTEFTALGSVLGILFSKQLTIPEINSVGNFLELVGQIMLTYGSQQNLFNDANNGNDYQEFNH